MNQERANDDDDLWHNENPTCSPGYLLGIAISTNHIPFRGDGEVGSIESNLAGTFRIRQSPLSDGDDIDSVGQREKGRHGLMMAAMCRHHHTLPLRVVVVIFRLVAC